MTTRCWGWAALLTIGTAAFGCDYDDGEPRAATDPPIAADEAFIDIGAEMEGFEPGRGAGLFVEVAPGGRWHVYATCDTLVSGVACQWDVVVRPLDTDELFDLVADRLEPDDEIFWWREAGFFSARLLTRTGGEVDGLFVTAPEGAPVQIDVLLDGQAAPDLVRWVYQDEVKDSAVTQAINFTPTEP
ncbi:MAG TPA: hypothetical protein VKZ49_07035 [Polyangiaceae bacterium]|nr:hypothetical protein [Polyangiaceae bacterium]